MLSQEETSKPLRSHLIGRSLWCAYNLAEILPWDFDDIHVAILKLASRTLLSEKKLMSLQLVATRSLIKFSRRVKPETLTEVMGDSFELLVDELAALLDRASVDTVHLPIEAFTAYSRLNESIVARMAPKITPKLLRFFRTSHGTETSLA